MSTFSPASILFNTAGTAIGTTIAAPVGNELGLIVRNIPSGIQAVSFDDGANAITFMNTTPTGTEYAVPVRQVNGVSGHFDAGNSSTVNLGPGAVFTGVGRDVLGHASVSFSASSDVVSATNGIELQWSPDNINWSTRGASSLPLPRTGPNNATDLIVRCHDRYFRIKYTNGPNPQTFFRLYVFQHNYIPNADGKGVAQTPVDGDDVILVKSVMAGKRPLSEGAGYTDVLVDRAGALLVTEAGTHAAFGAMLVSSESIRVNLSFPYGINTRLVETATVATGTVSHSIGRAALQTGINNAGLAKLESREAIKYTPGQGIIARFTAVFTPGVANSRQEIGIGDDLDGFFFGYNGTQFGVCRRVGGVDNWVAQANWNGDDKFDGTGYTGANLDPTKGYPYQIQYQWLGFGAIRFFIENPETGDFVMVHNIKFAGTSTVPSVNNPTLPLHAKVVNTGNTTNLALYTPSMGALAEGVTDNVGSEIPWSFTNIETTVTSAGLAIFNLRNKPTNVLGGVNTNRAGMHIDHVSLRSGGADDVLVTMYLNATIVGAVNVDVSASQSVAQTDVTGTTVGAGGIALRSFCVQGGSTINFDLSTYNIKLRPGETLSFVAFNESAGSASCRVAVGWHEEF